MRKYWVVPAGVAWVALIGVVFGQWWRWYGSQPTICFSPCPPPPADPPGQPWLSYLLSAATLLLGFALGRQRRPIVTAVLPLIGGILPPAVLPLLSTNSHPVLHTVIVVLIAALAVLAANVLLWTGWALGRLADHLQHRPGLLAR